jgi:hypothetical protein
MRFMVTLSTGIFARLPVHDVRVVSPGRTVVALILNGLGFTNRRLNLTPQFFASKPVERLLDAPIHAQDLNDYALGHGLDDLSCGGSFKSWKGWGSPDLRPVPERRFPGAKVNRTPVQSRDPAPGINHLSLNPSSNSAASTLRLMARFLGSWNFAQSRASRNFLMASVMAWISEAFFCRGELCVLKRVSQGSEHREGQQLRKPSGNTDAGHRKVFLRPGAR